VARGAVTLLSGGHGSGKSLLAIALASAVAAGAPSIAGMPVAGGAVVIIDAENGKRTLHERAHLADLPRDRVCVGIADGFDLRRPPAIKELHAAIAEGTALVILDSLASLAPG